MGLGSPQFAKTRKRSASSVPKATHRSAHWRIHANSLAWLSPQQKTAFCNGLPIVLGKRVLGTDYVVEHVTEFQTPAQFATSMLSGKLLSGAVARGAAANYD